VITIDANIFVSAIVFDGKPAALLLKAVEGGVEVGISPPTLDEVLRILRDKFGRSQAELEEAEKRILSFTRIFIPTHKLNVIHEDPDDDRILECAVASGSEVIVTGDKDLLRRVAYQGIKILTVAQFLERGPEMGV
jgi:putative PIN family toxin of toxin-antitoxin system